MENYKGLRHNQELIHDIAEGYIHFHRIEIDCLKVRKTTLVMKEEILKLDYIKINTF